MIKLIIVDDDEILLEGLSTYIERQQDRIDLVGKCCNGVDALEMIKCLRPDVVITDIRMPLMDGIELLEQIKCLDFDVEVIILSAYDEFSYAQRAIKSGVFDYVLKPIELDKLDEALEKVSAKVAERKELARFLPIVDKENNLNSYIEQAIDFINKSYSDPTLNMVKVASKVGISGNYFSTLFKKVTGKAFSVYLLDLRIEQAKRLLHSQQYRSYEVAYKVGFENLTYFNFSFKKIVGLSPMAYMKNL